MSELVNRPGAFDLAGISGRLRQSMARWRAGSLQNKSMLAIALLAAIVAATVVVMLWSAGQSYLPLYGRQEMVDSATVLEQLEKEGIPFRLDKSSGQVLVPENQLAKARMLLAARGVRAALPTGMEGLNDVGGLGTSEFMETVRYRHALEGELARTILALDGVRNARVHLAIPKRTLFVGREEEKPSASVMIDLLSGRRMDPEQVEAIVNLVAGSVPGMHPQTVTVVDQAGRLLSADIGDGANGRLSAQQVDYTRKLEDHIKQRAVDMLQPMLGTENFQVQVAADIDFNTVEETREVLDPQGVVQSETGKEDTTLDRLAAGVPGALSNRPPATATQVDPAAPGTDDAAAAAANAKATDSRSARSEFSRQYENSRSVTHTKYQQGRVKHLSVSVLLNNAAAPAPAKAGTTRQWSEAELAQVQDIVQKAVGFNGARGDQFNISAFNFTARAANDGAESTPWWQQAQQYEGYLRYLVGAILGLTLILVGVRPLVKHLIRPQPPLEGTLEAKAAEPMLGGSAHYRNELPAGAGLPDPGAQLQLDALPEPGSDFSVQLKHLQMLADKETARVAEVIKQWVSGNDRHA